MSGQSGKQPSANKITWPAPARRRAKDLEAAFKKNLGEVAERFASHERHTAVSPALVDRAFEALANTGLQRRRWIDRPESETAVGAFLVGFAFSCPDVVTVLVDSERVREVASTVLFVSLLAGLLLCFHAWYRGRLPSAPEDANSAFLWLRRIGLGILLTLVLYISWNMLNARFSGLWFEPITSTYEPDEVIP